MASLNAHPTLSVVEPVVRQLSEIDTRTGTAPTPLAATTSGQQALEGSGAPGVGGGLDVPRDLITMV